MANSQDGFRASMAGGLQVSKTRSDQPVQSFHHKPKKNNVQLHPRKIVQEQKAGRLRRQLERAWREVNL